MDYERVPGVIVRGLVSPFPVIVYDGCALVGHCCGGGVGCDVVSCYDLDYSQGCRHVWVGGEAWGWRSAQGGAAVRVCEVAVYWDDWEGAGKSAYESGDSGCDEVERGESCPGYVECEGEEWPVGGGCCLPEES